MSDPVEVAAMKIINSLWTHQHDSYDWLYKVISESQATQKARLDEVVKLADNYAPQKGQHLRGCECHGCELRRCLSELEKGE